LPNLTPECVNTIRRARSNRLRRPETKARNHSTAGIPSEEGKRPETKGRRIGKKRIKAAFVF